MGGGRLLGGITPGGSALGGIIPGGMPTGGIVPGGGKELDGIPHGGVGLQKFKENKHVTTVKIDDDIFEGANKPRRMSESYLGIPKGGGPRGSTPEGPPIGGIGGKEEGIILPLEVVGESSSSSSFAPDAKF